MNVTSIVTNVIKIVFYQSYILSCLLPLLLTVEIRITTKYFYYVKFHYQQCYNNYVDIPWLLDESVLVTLNHHITVNLISS